MTKILYLYALTNNLTSLMRRILIVIFTAVALFGLSSCSKEDANTLANTSWVYEYEDDPEYRNDFYRDNGVYPSVVLNFRENTVSWVSLGMSLFESEYEFNSPSITIYIPEFFIAFLEIEDKALTGTVKGNEMVISNYDVDPVIFHKK